MILGFPISRVDPPTRIESLLPKVVSKQLHSIPKPFASMASTCQSFTCTLHQLRLILSQGFLLITVALASGGYYSANNTILSSPYYVSPCGASTKPSPINCCAVQSGNICLSDSICYIPGSNSYYLSPCTDPTYSAPECPLYCSMSLCLYLLSIPCDSTSTNRIKVIVLT